MTTKTISLDTKVDALGGFWINTSGGVDGALFTADAATNTVTTNAETYVYGDERGMVLTGSAGSWKVTVNGGIYGAGDNGLDLTQTNAAFLSTITVGTTGDIYGFGSGIRADHATSITNNAVIAGETDSGIRVVSEGFTKSFLINNTKTGIIASGMGYGIELEGGASDPTKVTRTITNAGVIVGDLGAINTDPTASNITKDIVTNTGTLGDEDVSGSGQVSLGMGDDTFTNSGFVFGSVYVGDGNDTVNNSKEIEGSIFGGDGNDTIKATAGTIGGAIDTGKGSDSVTNGGVVDGYVDLGAAADVTGTVNTLTNTKTINGSIFGGAGDDKITNSGSIVGDVLLGDGNNEFKGTGGTVDGGVYGGAGNDIYSSGAKVSDYVDLGAGSSNSFTNAKGQINGTNIDNVSVFSESTVQNVFNNSGTIVGHVSLSDGIKTTGLASTKNGSTFTNSGTIGDADYFDGSAPPTNVYLSDGVEVVTNTGNVYGAFYLGDGADTYNGSGNRDIVVDGGGADVVKLGADKAVGNPEADPGDMYFAMLHGIGTDGTDTIDGGTGGSDAYISGQFDGDDLDPDEDIFDLATNSVFINLDSTKGGHTDNALGALSTSKLVAENTAFGLDVSGSDTGTGNVDKITGFEWAVGGLGADVIFGNASANLLLGEYDGFGPGGNDSLYGYAGNDFIYGGDGDDVIVGGAGKDTLIGGDGADIFVYDLQADSTFAAAGRDLIEDFDVANDVLDFSSFKAIATGSDLTFTFLGMNAAWTSATIEARAIWTATGTQVQIDTNGDNKIDFAIDLTGKLELTDANFLSGATTFGTNGDDTPAAFTVATTYFAAAGDDVVTGSGSKDTIQGGAGNDTLSGAGGDDTLVGGAGIDVLNGGDNNDTLRGGDDNDTLNGGNNDDTLEGGAGDDELNGGAGNDTAKFNASLLTDGYELTTDNTNVFVDGTGNGFGEGIDTIATDVEFVQFADGKYKLIRGTNASDPSVPADALVASLVLAFNGDDTLTSGAANDILVGGDGTDTLSFAAQTASVTVVMDTGDGLGSATGTGIGSDVFGEIENVTGGSKDDSLTGDDFDNTLDGGAGNDTLTGGDGSDTLIGGADTDTAVYSGAVGDYTIIDLGGGDFQVDGTLNDEGVDDLYDIEKVNFGGTVFTVEVGGVGDENFNGTSGNDFVLAGDGDDTVVGSASDDIYNGGSNTSAGDTLDYQNESAAVTVDLGAGTASGTGIGNDTFGGFENVTGGSGGDTLTGDAGDNVILGGGGVDTISGGGGDDTISGGDGADIITVGTLTAGDADHVRFSETSEFGDTVTGFWLGEDMVEFASTLNLEYDDITADDNFQFKTLDGNNGGAEVVDITSITGTAEAVLLTGLNSEGLSDASLTNASALATELNSELVFTSTVGSDALIVVNSTNTDRFSVWQFVENGSGVVQSGELTLIGVFSSSGNAATTDFDFIV